MPLPPGNERKAWKWLEAKHHYTSHNPPHILIIGEAPGEAEDFKGAPFYGTSGVLLDAILTYSSSTFLATITNTVCCRPIHTKETTPDIKRHGKNREPEASEQEHCLDHILELLGSYKFHGILLLGKVAEKYHNQHLTHNLSVLCLKRPLTLAKMDYKLYTIKEEARRLQLWIKELKS
jgi:uracil-DNA glycosylase family 4